MDKQFISINLDIKNCENIFCSKSDFEFEEKDGKRQYDGTTIFTVDGSELDLYYYAQVSEWFDEEYMIINNITVQYEEIYFCFDHISYKSDILKEINYESD